MNMRFLLISCLDCGTEDLICILQKWLALWGKMASRFDDDDEVTDFRVKLNNSCLLLSTIR